MFFKRGNRTIGVQTVMCDPVKFLTSKIKTLRNKCRLELSHYQNSIAKLKAQSRELHFYVSLFQFEADLRKQLATDEPTTYGILEDIVRLKKEIKDERKRQCELMKEYNSLSTQANLPKRKIVKFKWDKCLNDFIADEEDDDNEMIETMEEYQDLKSKCDEDYVDQAHFANIVTKLVVRNVDTAKQLSKLKQASSIFIGNQKWTPEVFESFKQLLSSQSINFCPPIPLRCPPKKVTLPCFLRRPKGQCQEKRWRI